MVESTNQNQALDVKLSLDLSAQGKSPIVKRVIATDFATLTAQMKKLASKHGISESDCLLRYHDGDNWVIVEDDEDLQLAFAIGLSNSSKLMFTVKPSAPAKAQAEVSSFANDNDEEMKEEAPATGHKKGKKDKVKGIPRKALKNLINNELDKQAEGIFKQLIKSDDLPAVEQSAEEGEVVHEGIQCDGCDAAPIKGLRYKCSVCKNFDFCASCEERLGHEHAFLKIRKAGGAPDVMITMLDENNPEPSAQPESTEESKDPMDFINQMINKFAGGHRGGRGGRGGRGRGCHGGGGPPFRHMMKQFMEKMGEMTPEDIAKCKQQFMSSMGNNCGGQQNNWNFQGKKDWKEARAVIVKKPEDVIELQPGLTRIVEFEVLNDTFWPWKPNCSLTLADEQADFNIPIDVFTLPVEQQVKGKASAKFEIPLTMAQHIVADDEKVYEVKLTFRGPMGQPFGALIPLKIKCVLPRAFATDVEIYKLAIKLHEQLSLGSLDDCIRVARESNCDEAESIKALQRKEE